MKELIETLKKHNIKAKSYKKIGSVIIVDTKDSKYAIKKMHNKDIFNYLSSRSFNYYPNYIDDDNYLLMEYLDSKIMPDDEKFLDMIKLISLLHNKTTYYSSVDIDSYKKDYENIKIELIIY